MRGASEPLIYCLLTRPIASSSTSLLTVPEVTSTPRRVAEYGPESRIAQRGRAPRSRHVQHARAERGMLMRLANLRKLKFREGFFFYSPLRAEGHEPLSFFCSAHKQSREPFLFEFMSDQPERTINHLTH